MRLRARQVIAFAMANKIYWVLPLVVVGLALAAVLATSTTAASPVIYSVH
jgi:hypothetical protein